MKNMKKIFALLLAVVMVMGLSVTVFAADITVSNAVKGQTYTAYKLFDVTTTADGTGYAYTISADSSVLSVIYDTTTKTSKVEGLTLTLSAGGSVYNVALTEEGATALAQYLNNNKSSLTATKSVEATGDSVTISDLAAGYYFVDSSLGAVCALVTTDSKFIVLEKNSEPTDEKKIIEGENEVDDTTASIGDTVNFQITVTAGGAADTSYVVHDTMSEGLTLDDESFAIKVNGTAVENSNYEIKTSELDDSCTFEITFLQIYTATLTKGTEIVITYSAVVNEKATDVTNSETNTSHVTYGNTSSVDDTVTVYSYSFDIVKTDNSNAVLTGAKFKLYDAETGGNEIALVKVTDSEENTFYRPAVGNEVGVEIEAGTAEIRGLASGTYYLEETQAPDGYNALTERKSITINGASSTATVTDDTYENGGLQVVNQSGTELPSTGGIGTTIFYVVGTILVLGAAILLITKKRMSNVQ